MKLLLPLFAPFLLCDHSAAVKFTTHQKNYMPLVMDMSTTCSNQLINDIYLPLGRGIADSAVILISASASKKTETNCALSFLTSEQPEANQVFIILVIEFLNYLKRPKGSKGICRSVSGGIYLKYGPNETVYEICEVMRHNSTEDNAQEIYRRVFSSRNISMQVNVGNMSGSIKFTATSARLLGKHDHCDRELEVRCVVGEDEMCINQQLQCDGNINCGFIDLYDEDIKVCDVDRYKNLWMIAVYGCVTALILVYIAVQLLRICVPTAANNFFIFNEDEDNKLILASQLQPPPDKYSESFHSKDLEVLSKINVRSSQGSSVVSTPKTPPPGATEDTEEMEIKTLDYDKPKKPAKKQRFDTEVTQID